MTHESFFNFFLTCPAVEGNDGAALVAAWHLASMEPPQMLSMCVYKSAQAGLRYSHKTVAEMQRVDFFSLPC